MNETEDRNEEWNKQSKQKRVRREKQYQQKTNNFLYVAKVYYSIFLGTMCYIKYHLYQTMLNI